MKPQSLRGSLVVGAVIWTVGLFMISFLTLHIIMPNSAARVVLISLSRYAHPIAFGGIICLAFGFWYVRRAVAPINRLRERLLAVHRGAEERVAGDYPVEVRPLVDDLNALLEERERRVARAVAKAGDLAHGLKTPLAVLTHEARQARQAGHADLADALDQQIEAMRRQVEYHLAFARAGTPTAGSRTPVADAVEGLARALKRIHSGREIGFEVVLDGEPVFRGRREELDEMLGNLLDNAFKWAKGEVRISGSAIDGRLILIVDDDGPGIEPALREVVLLRGMRADEAGPGSGLGLSIVRELAELHGGGVALETSPLGGLRATLTLPAAPHR
jgi:signal transduction histidine kinase